MQKLTEVALSVAGEGAAIDEAAPPVQSECRLERRSTACFQAQTLYLTHARLGDDPLKNGRTSAHSKKVGMGAHRFDLGSSVRQHLQRPHAGHYTANPSRPHGNLRRL
jgi:hypothetical protein